MYKAFQAQGLPGLRRGSFTAQNPYLVLENYMFFSLSAIFLFGALFLQSTEQKDQNIL